MWEAIKFLREIDERGPAVIDAALKYSRSTPAGSARRSATTRITSTRSTPTIADADEASGTRRGGVAVQQQLIA